MKGVLVLVAVCVIIGVVCGNIILPNHDVIEDALFNDFVKKYNKNYSPAELQYRKSVFRDNLSKIQKHSKDASFQIGVTKFADLTHAEFLTVTRQAPVDYRVETYSADEELRGVAPPASLDWRTTKPAVVGPVRSTDTCGGAEISAIIDSVSADYSVSSKEEFYGFDPKYISECDGKGCTGQDINTIWNFISKFGLNWYYTTCPTGPGLGLCITGTNCTKSGSENDLLTAVATHGPIAVLIDASHTSFQLYKSGIYYEPACSPAALDHSLLIVGYGSQDGQDYWIARNAWGTGWGQGGDVLLARNKNNNCGVATSACYAKQVHTCVCTL